MFFIFLTSQKFSFTCLYLFYFTTIKQNFHSQGPGPSCLSFSIAPCKTPGTQWYLINTLNPDKFILGTFPSLFCCCCSSAQGPGIWSHTHLGVPKKHINCDVCSILSTLRCSATELFQQAGQ